MIKKEHLPMSAVRRILIIDDDQDFLLSTRRRLRGEYGILTAISISEGLRLLENNDVDLVLLDVGLGKENGLDGIKKIHEVHPLVGVAMLSGMSDVKTVVQAIRTGAMEYLTKPINTEDIAKVVEKAVVARDIHEKREALFRTQLNGKNGKKCIIYKGPAMQTLMGEVEQVRGHRANVLIIGDTGTGKELLARHIHEQELDKKRPFITVNCGAIPEHLLESELFGHEAGAFTGATRRRIGIFELADGGDIFLDEISAMKSDLQVKLLRVLQEKEFCRLGSNTPIHAEFRVIAASNQSLDALVENGAFRKDLYHRLRVMQFVVPPLSERKEDIPLMVEHFLDKFKTGSQRKLISEDALERLIEYSWPGNVRELSNVVQSLVIMSQGDVIDDAAFPRWILNGCGHVHNATAANSTNNAETVSKLNRHVRAAEKCCIEEELKKHDGDKTKVAAALGIGRTTLYSKLKELGLM